MYEVGVIGLGQIAAGYGTPQDKAPYCHVGGIRFSRKVRLAAVSDVSEKARAAFKEKWGALFPDAKYYPSGAAMLQSEPLDIVAICVKGPLHHQVFMETVKASPRAIFLEKPPSCSLWEMDTMVAAAKAKSIPITVSYSRHWTPHVLRLAELVQEGLIGEVRSVIGYTGSAFLSFASHTTDLICQFAGYCPVAVYARGSVGGEAPAGYQPEPAMSGMLIEFANGVDGIQVGQDGAHGGFCCEVIGTEGRVRAGMYTPPFACKRDGTEIELSRHRMPEPASVLTVAYNQIADHLDGGPLPHCTDEQFITVNEIGFAGIESVITNRRVPVPNRNRTRRFFANG